jgi:trimeric autotransporter adhesin
MKNTFVYLFLCLISTSGFAQNSIETPTGIPLTIGNQGVKLANLTSASTPAASNNRALSVDATGNIILVPASTGGGNPTFRIVNNSNTMGGTNSGNALTNGVANTFVGFNAGAATGANSTGSENSFFGSNAGLSTTDGNNNTFFGAGTGVYNTLGSNNTFLGTNAGANNQTGAHNIMIGINAGYDGTPTLRSNSYNTYIGNFAGRYSSANFNTFIGYAAGQYSTTGTNNIYMGNYTGGFTGITNNSNCIFVGDFAGSWTGTNPSAPTTVVNNLTNAIAIGFQSQVTVSNALVLGGTGTNAVKVGVGLTNPAFPLDVKGQFNLRAALNSPSIKINGHDFMGVGSEENDFWVSNFKIRYQDEKQWSDKVFEKSYKLLKIKELDRYIRQNKHLPNIPSAKEVVEKGIDNAQITSKLLEKIEEMSLYIIQLEKALETLNQRVSKIESMSKNQDK